MPQLLETSSVGPVQGVKLVGCRSVPHVQKEQQVPGQATCMHEGSNLEE